MRILAGTTISINRSFRMTTRIGFISEPIRTKYEWNEAVPVVEHFFRVDKWGVCRG